MSRKLAQALIAAMAAGALWMAGCSSPAARGLSPSASSPTVVRRGTLEDRFLLTGELRSVRSIKMVAPRTRTWNITIRWLAPEGSSVRAGDPVAQFDNSGILSKLEDQRQELAEAEKQFQKNRSDLEVQRLQKSLEARRQQTARDKARLEAEVPEGLRARRDFQEKQLALEKAEAALQKATRDVETFQKTAETQLRVLEVQKEKAKREVDRAVTSLEQLTLKAPQDGILIYGRHPWEFRKWQVGDELYPGMTVAELPDLSKMQVEAWLSDVDDGEVLAGMPTRCFLDAFPDRPFSGQVRSVSPAAEERSQEENLRFFRVSIDLQQSDPKVMRPGMSVRGEVIRKRWQDHLLVPRASLDFSTAPPRLRMTDGRMVKVDLAGCNEVECALKPGSSGKTLLGEAR